MEEWKKYKLGEILTVKYGKDHKKLDAGSIPVYGSGGLMRFVNSYICDSPSILIPRKGSLNNVMYVEHPFWTVDTMFWTIIDTTIAVPRFVYYAICKIDFESLNVGSAVPSMTVPIIEDIEIFLPSLDEQKRIVKVLSSLESKIELNRQINDNLEQQAQALYKSWFVDFEPFKNAKFIESELGLIPEGWKIGKINDVINLLSGFPFKSSDFQENGDYQLITIKGVQDGYLDVTSADRLSSLPSKMPQYCILNIGDILISLTGNVGRICIVDRNNLLLNQRVAILSPKNIRDSFYAYTMFRSESMKNELIHLARGTAQLNLSPIETGEKLTVIPPDSILEAFAKVGKGTFNQYISLKMENIRLMEMRDSLLPKLMSGELKINEIDC